MILLSHPTGNENLRQAMRAMQEAGLLHSLHTTIGLSESSALDKLPLPGRLKTQLQKRKFALPANQLHTQPWRELVRLALINRRENFLVRHETGPCSVDGVYHALDRKLAPYVKQHAQELSAVYGYEDGCLEHFQAAKAAGLTTIYELPIAYGPFAKAMLDEEARQRPDWEPTLIATRDSAQKQARKRQELELADVVVTPGAFVESSIPAELRAGRTLLRMPYGTDEPEAANCQHDNDKRPLRFLYAGALSQRKGLADLFEAWQQAALPHAELHIMGSLLMPQAFYEERCPGAVFHGPRPRPQVLALMDRCDVLVLPSLIEGRALVQLEALGRGLPLLITPNTGGDDLIEMGETGFIVPIRSPEALAEKLAWFNGNRKHLPQMREACLRKARETSWQNYRSKLAEALQRVLTDG